MSDTRFVAYRDEVSGLRFVFKHDRDAPELLHIYARHLTTIEEAVTTFFSCQPVYNAKRRRFETWSRTHGLFWFWLCDKTDIMVISCFRRYDPT